MSIANIQLNSANLKKINTIFEDLKAIPYDLEIRKFNIDSLTKYFLKISGDLQNKFYYNFASHGFFKEWLASQPAKNADEIHKSFFKVFEAQVDQEEGKTKHSLSKLNELIKSLSTSKKEWKEIIVEYATHFIQNPCDVSTSTSSTLSKQGSKKVTKSGPTTGQSKKQDKEKKNAEKYTLDNFELPLAGEPHAFATLYKQGEGVYGVVSKCISLAKDKTYSIKILKKMKGTKAQHEKRISEKIRDISSKEKRFLKVEVVHEDEKSLYILMESGEGCLTDFIEFVVREDKSLSENQFKQIILGFFIMMKEEISFWEKNNLYHCDVKLDNFLLVSRDDENLELMLIDPSQCSYPSGKMDFIFEDFMKNCNLIKHMEETNRLHF
jgi:hypothetical protein